MQTPSAPVPAAAPASGTPSGNAPTTPSPAPATTTGGTTEGGNFNDPSALTLGAQREAAIANMESMGFPRADIDRAMRAAFFNPDRAVEYLLNVSIDDLNIVVLANTIQGIPENVQQDQRQATQPAPAAGATGTREAAAPAPTTANNPGAAPSGDSNDQPINLFEAAAQAGRGGSGGRAARTGAGGGAGLAGLGAGAGAGAAGGGEAAAAGLGNLDFLRNNPQFQQLRQVVQNQPQMLEPILQQVGAGNPQLAQLIGSNPDQFLQLLSEDVDEDAPMPPGAQAISVTEEEREAIERVGLKFYHFSNTLLISTAVPSRVRKRYGHSGLLRMRQERRARCQLPLRPARRG